jgi:cyclin T
MSESNHWYFSEQQILDSPSRSKGVSPDKEEYNRQQAAALIQELGQRLGVTQLCINTAIVYMHRFYMFHSVTTFHRNDIAASSIFLAAKIEEQPQRLEKFINTLNICIYQEQSTLNLTSAKYLGQTQELLANENVLLETFGFDMNIIHPHIYITKGCQLFKASKELFQTAYLLATNSLHLTTLCLRYQPSMVACVCIQLACIWSKYKIPDSEQEKSWFLYIDKNATITLIDKITQEFLYILEKSPNKIRKANQQIFEEQNQHNKKLKMK